MTIFKNNGVLFVDLFGWAKSSFSGRSLKQIGKISKAVNTLNKINEDINVKNLKDAKIINKLENARIDRNDVKRGNRALIKDLRKFL